MKCQKCKERDATIQIVQNHGAENQQNILLCSTCAKKLGISVPSIATEPEQTMNSLLNHLIGQYFGYENKPERKKTVESCSRCKMTVEDFRKKGRLGCSDCYTAFSAVLDSVFPKIQHQRTRHKGRACGQFIQEDLTEQPKLENNKDTTEQMKKKAINNEEKVLVSPSAKAEKSKVSANKKKNAEFIAQKELLLRDAIDKEDYLKAAKIRDELKTLRKVKGVKPDGD